MEGWDGELSSLQSETDALLRRVRGDAPAPSASRTPPPKKAKKRTSAKKKKRSALSKSLGAPAMRDLRETASPAPGERTTLEVLDARPASARSDTEEWGRIKEEAAARTELEKQREAQRAETGEQEQPDRELAFDAETAKIDDGVLSFVPRADFSRLELSEQKAQMAARLAEAEQRAAAAEQRDSEMGMRRELLDQELAAASLQRVYRGHLGRRRTEVGSAESDRLDSPATTTGRYSAWKELRDEDQGLVWYFNEVTGHSQWERPEIDEAIGCVRLPALAHTPQRRERGEADEDRSDVGDDFSSEADSCDTRSEMSEPQTPSKAKLPPLSLGGDSPPRTASSSGTRPGTTKKKNKKKKHTKEEKGGKKAQSSRQQQQQQDFETESEQGGEGEGDGDGDGEDDDLDEDDSGEASPRLFLGDGSVNVTKLRDTVRHALTVSRFESVSTVLASHKPKAKPRPAAQGLRFKADNPQMLVSVIVDKPRKGGSKDPRARTARSAVSADSASESGSPRSPSKRKQLKAAAPTLRDVTHDGFSVAESTMDGDVEAIDDDDDDDAESVNANGETLQQVKDRNKAASDEVCFSCWSAGQGKRCDMHMTDTGKIVRSANSILMCKHWDLGVLRRRYRAEEIQEVFLKQNSSLKWHREMKQFVSVVEMRHPIYRIHSTMLDAENARMRRKLHVHAWFRSFLEELRKGKVEKAGSSKTPALLRLKNTLANNRYISSYSNKCRDQHPLAPITGRSSLAPYVTDEIEELEPDPGTGEARCLFITPPTPVPIALYLPRTYHPFAHIEVPLQDPKYRIPPAPPVPNEVMEEAHPASWFERFCASEARDTVIRSQMHILSLCPPPGTENSRRSKYPLPATIKFSIFGQRARRKNLAVGGLPSEVRLYQVVTTVVPPQFGNFSVTDKRSVAPNISPEVTVTIRGILVNPFIQQYIHRPLEHPMNMRRAPSIMVSTIARDYEMHFYGKNRPAQTGEEQPNGFRTAVSMTHFLVDDKIPTSVFVPTADVALPNQMAANRTVTTHVDRDYPFCEPTNRDNSTLDFYHLLLLGRGSGNKAQVFTNLGRQDPGEFGMENDLTRPMGNNAAMVYRSWAFVQESEFEEFLTDDGVPYWYSHRTEETFWERPLHEVEKRAIIDGGTVIDSSAEIVTKGVGVSEDSRYSVSDMREYIRSKSEAPDEVKARAENVNSAIQQAKADGIVLERRASAVAAPGPGGGRPDSAGPRRSGLRGDRNPTKLDPAYLPQERPQVVGGGGAFGVAAGAGGVQQWNSNAEQLAAMQHDGPAGQQHAELRPDSRGAVGQLGVPRAHIGVPGARPGLPGLDTSGASRAVDVPEHMYEQLSSRPTTGTTMRPDTRETSIPSGGYSRPGTAGSFNGPSGELGDMGALFAGADMLPGGQLPPHAQAIIQSLAQAVSSALPGNGQGLMPSDLLQLGVGLGVGLGLQQAMGGSPSRQQQGQGQGQGKPRPPSALRGPNSESRGKTVSLQLPDEAAHGLPIGAAQPQPPPNRPALLATVVEPKPPLDSHQQYQGIHVVSAEPTPTPDEVENPLMAASNQQAAADPLADVPAVVAGAVGQDYVTRQPAGLGTSFSGSDSNLDVDHRQVDEEGNLRRAGDVLPAGFIETVMLPHKGRMYVDYLPHEPNVNVARAVGVAKPRTAAEDWLAIGYDPWSAGKEPLTIEFVSNLAANADRMVQGSGAAEDGAAAAGADASSGVSFLTTIDSAAAEREAAQKRQAELLDQLFSWCRHGKFHELEEALSDPTIDIDIDAKNEVGNSLLLISAQNNNKRICKLCLRRGADINAQNLNGQSVLHYAYAFGFTELAEYLHSKGADDTLLNADSLTCYEGLHLDDVEGI